MLTFPAAVVAVAVAVAITRIHPSGNTTEEAVTPALAFIKAPVVRLNLQLIDVVKAALGKKIAPSFKVPAFIQQEIVYVTPAVQLSICVME
jgi:hypothetical protein